MVSAPLVDVRLRDALEARRQCHAGALRGFGRPGAEREGEHELRDARVVATARGLLEMHLARERHIAVSRLAEFDEPPLLAQLAPAVVDADVATAQRAPATAARE